MANLLQVYKLIEDQTIAGLSSVESTSVDMRRNARIEALFLKAAAAGYDADVKLEWAGSPLDASTHFEPYTNNDALVTSTDTDFLANKEDWHRVIPGDFRSPFVKFRITDLANSTQPTLVSLFAYIREDFE